MWMQRLLIRINCGTERILVLVKDLDERAKKVFLAVQSRQIMLAKVMGAYLQRCEDYNVSSFPCRCLRNQPDDRLGRRNGSE